MAGVNRLSVLSKLTATHAPCAVIIIMAVAVWTTKVPTLLKSGFWGTAHEGRADFSMILGALFLLVVGAGGWSLNRWIYGCLAQNPGGKP